MGRRPLRRRASRRVGARRPNLHARLVAVLAVIAVLLAGLVGRLGQLQLDPAPVAAGDGGPSTSTQVVLTPAPRGRILDRRGVPLADDAVRLDVTLDRAVLADEDDAGRSSLRALARDLGVTPESLRDRLTLCGAPDAAPAPRCWPGSAYVPVTVAEGVSSRLALRLGERGDRYPAAEVVTTAVRRDHEVPLAPQVLGYLTPADAATVEASAGRIHDGDLVGRAGLEQQYDDVLRGEPGSAEVRVDARGIATGTEPGSDPVPGDDVVTTIDARVQRATQEALAEGVRDAQARGLPADEAAAVVVDVRDGGVVASASVPTYDPSVWTGGISSAEYERLTGRPGSTPLTDRVTGGAYPPASTFKVVTMPAVVAPDELDEQVDCASSVRIGDRTFRNFESRAYGRISWHRALVVSCDTVFYTNAERVWERAGGLSGRDADDAILATARDLGLGERTGVDLPVESAGRLPGRTWKREYWEATKDESCRRARDGYPDVADATRASYLRALARESCANGYQFRPGDEVNLSIGQGDTLVTPLQMAQVYAAIATGGSVRTPRLVSATRTAQGERTARPLAPARTVDLDPAMGRYLRSALEGVVTEGTGAGAFRGFDLDAWPVAGKTGTAEVFGEEDTAWFVSYAPADRPRYAVAVVVGQGGTGGGTAAGIAREIHASLARTTR
ncbi:penicillin-binding transpeptidase domain-containing protein [Janibacter melonis]|uniref:peptidoglycan D,D-transpeptidase FtsI family protein n=1 Tax=Janibacter melonis TaxID=262209 RepID=UPI0020431D69|nr:penicillin-binding transpeptidase domain-containing protein [Janibacter melonis]MCM3554018.1 penicillin-binding transpeptidase domain-containing protein [Janibacter melonis]